LTGLNAASKELSVTANNIANSSTTGFKKSSVSFGDIFASSPTQNKNSAVGQGVAIKSVNQQFTQGFIEFSSNALDLAITGAGFFPLQTSDGADVYTRSGVFMLDTTNTVVNSAGQKLLSIPVDSVGRADFNQNVQPLIIPPNTTGQAQATTQIDLEINLPADASVPADFDINDPSTFNESTSVSVYDSNGNARNLTLYYRLAQAPVAGTNGGTWEVYGFLDGEQIGAAAPAELGTISFDTSGAQTGAAPIDLGAVLSTNNATLNIANATEMGSKFELVSVDPDGRGEGELLGIDINDQGLVSASYSNGMQVNIGKVLLTNFDAPGGLRQLGDSSFIATADSGDPRIQEAGSAGFGTIRAGALERSNVDLTEELVSMINSQRKFQANAKAIETNSTLAQTIINLRS
jgi:flagellar hook protein FlgE